MAYHLINVPCPKNPILLKGFVNLPEMFLSCSNVNQCVAVGTSGSTAVILSTTGSNSWSSVSLPSNVTYSKLLSVSCPVASTLTSCYATGTTSNGSPAIAQISYNGTSWLSVDQSSAIPYGTKSLPTIGCGYATSCLALGNSGYGFGQILYTSNSGTNWTSQVQITEYSYTTQGHLASVEDGTGTTGNISYSYDPLGRLISQTDEFGVTTDYTYDLNSNMTSVTYPGGHSVTRTFNGANELTSVSTWLVGPGTCGTYLEPTDTTNFTYDNNGSLTSEQFPTCDTKNSPNSPDVVNYNYDNNGFVSNLSGTWQGTNYNVAYSNNADGMIYNRTITPANSTTTYSYNNLGQVSSVTNPNQTFQYDNAGNVTCNQSGQYMTYNSIGQPNYAYQTCGSTATEQNSFTYDAYGDRTQTMFPWNGQLVPENYLYSNTLGELSTYQIFLTNTNYSYSGTGQLMQVTQGSSTLAQMTWNEASSTPKILSDSNWDFIYGPNGKAIEAIKISNSQQYYLLSDPSGSVLLNFSQNGTINNVTLYNTYGGGTSSTAPPIGWDNSYEDPANGLNYLNNRFYDPNTGQFITQDPRLLALNQPYSFAGIVSPEVGGLAVISNPLTATSANAYQFAADNPVNFKDPTGLCATCHGPTVTDWIGVALGAVSTGLATASMLMPGSELAPLLKGGSLVTGFAATSIDASSCANRVWQACVGAGLGMVGLVAGGTDYLGNKVDSVGNFLEDTGIGRYLDNTALGASGDGVLWDGGNAVVSALSC